MIIIQDNISTIGRPVRTYLHQLCANTGCSLEELPGVTGNRDGRGESRGNLFCQCDLIMMITSVDKGIKIKKVY